MGAVPNQVLAGVPIGVAAGSVYGFARRVLRSLRPQSPHAPHRRTDAR